MIFSREELNQQLDIRGYVVIPFFNAKEVSRLLEIYSAYKSPSAHFHSTTFSKNIEEKKAVTEKVEEVFSSKVDSFFTGCKKMGASFLTKPGGEGGFMPVHQDWTIVDESKFGSYTIWVPLQDVNETNGAITVLDGSHRLHATLRAPSLPVVIKDMEPLIRQRMTTLNMKAGEAFIFNHALIHASHLNATATDRIAVTFGLVPEAAQLLFYHLRNDGAVDKYEVEDDFFMRYDNHGERPVFIEPKAQVSETFEPVSEKQFLKFCSEYKMRIMKPIFKDVAIQEQYNRDGYAVVDMLSETQVEELKAYYASLNNDHIPSYGFHVSLDNSKSDFVTEVMKKIQTTIKENADKVFKDYKIFTSSFVVKESNPISIVPPHQDWSFTEEDEGFTSSTVWIALVETNMQNGAMGIIAGSHKFFDHHRASPAPEFKAPIDPHVFSIFPYLKLIPMKPGQALIFDNRTMHASPPNVSDKVRLAVGFGVTQADAPLRHYYMEPGSNTKRLIKYEVDDFFFTNYNNGKLLEIYKRGEKPEGLKYLETVDNRVREISADDLVAKIKEAGNVFNVEMCEHLAKLFNYNMDGSKKEEPAPVTQPDNKPEEKVPVSANNAWEDRSFFQKYTPLNIIREIKERVFAD